MLPQSRSGRIMNRKRQFMTCFKYTSFIIGLGPINQSINLYYLNTVKSIRNLKIKDNLTILNKIQNLTTTASSRRKKKSRKVLSDWVRLFGMPVPKNVTKRDAIAKKGMLSCLILSSLDYQKCPKMRIFQESPRVNAGNRFIFQ